MSKVLGPIHYQMFDKILFLRGLNEELAKESDLSYVSFVWADKLEELIDQGNIHASLQEMVYMVQKEHAGLMEEAIAHNGKEAVEKLLVSYGKQHPLQGEDVQEVFMHYQQTFLYGMPCDHNLIMTEHGEHYIKAKIKEDKQKSFFKQTKFWEWEMEILVNAMLQGYRYIPEEAGFLLEEV